MKYAHEGLDVYYDNVGGEQLETALMHMKDLGTVIANGMVAVYETPGDEEYGVRTLMEIFFEASYGLMVYLLRLLFDEEVYTEFCLGYDLVDRTGQY